jgi:hypothetical protein
VSKRVERDLPVSVPEYSLLLAGEVERGYAASTDVGEHDLEGELRCTAAVTVCRCWGLATACPTFESGRRLERRPTR